MCDKNELTLVVDLGMQPWCNHFLLPEEVGKEPYYPLRVLFCQSCHTAQLDYTVPKEIMFGNHTYLSGVTSSLSEHFRSVSKSVDDMFFQDNSQKSVLDIGSNDGTQLKHFKDLGYDVLGVESSSRTAAIANSAGIPTINKFFNLETAKSISRKFHVINAAGVFFHLEELHSVTEGIREALREDGVFVVQFLYMKRILENNAFDQIYHEHLLYYNLETIEILLARHGLTMFDAWMSPIHGGSIIGLVSHQGKRAVSERLVQLRSAENETGANTCQAYLDFAERIREMKEQNLAYLREKNAAGDTVFGLGAPVKGNTLINYFGIKPDLIQCLVEKNGLRRGLFAPGSHIPVKIEDEITASPNTYYVLAWNFKREVLARHAADVAKGVHFYFPVNPSEI